MKEEWRAVPGYEGLYEVSNMGRIWIMRKCRLMTIKPDNRNRCTIELSKNGIKKSYILARLVGTAFIREPDPDEEINHLDENPFNNCVENLEWCTYSENLKHAWDMGLNQGNKKGKNQWNSEVETE